MANSVAVEPVEPPFLVQIRSMWVSAVLGVIDSRCATWRVEGDEGEHLHLAWRQPGWPDRAKHWARSVRADLQRWASDALYLNFEGDEGQDRVVAGLGAENFARLASVKAHYDPDNVFHLNHNIKPA